MKLPPIAVALTLAASASPVGAETLDPSDPVDAHKIRQRIHCTGEMNTAGATGLSGSVYSRRQGEKDRLIFKVEGIGINRCMPISDPVRGEGYRVVNREIVFYLDPETGEIVDRWENPWTGETVDVIHIANDPVSGNIWPRDEEGKPYPLEVVQKGEWAFVQNIFPLFYHNPMGGDYQDYVGGKYHAMEMFTYVALADRLLSVEDKGASPTTAWTRVSDWMPWMKMRGREGAVIFNAVAAPLPGGTADLPPAILKEIQTKYPVYLDAPPADDVRPNDTTWTVNKRAIDAQRAAEGTTPDTSGH